MDQATNGNDIRDTSLSIEENGKTQDQNLEDQIQKEDGLSDYIQIENKFLSNRQQFMSNDSSGLDSKINVPVYDIKTNIDAIPYENETEQYTQLTIANQRKDLVKEALNYGLKLKS